MLENSRPKCTLPYSGASGLTAENPVYAIASFIPKYRT